MQFRQRCQRHIVIRGYDSLKIEHRPQAALVQERAHRVRPGLRRKITREDEVFIQRNVMFGQRRDVGRIPGIGSGIFWQATNVSQTAVSVDFDQVA